VPLIVAALASGLIVMAFGRIMPARTTAARTLERLLGFGGGPRRTGSSGCLPDLSSRAQSAETP
jgi:hypothetical protein